MPDYVVTIIPPARSLLGLRFQIHIFPVGYGEEVPVNYYDTRDELIKAIVILELIEWLHQAILEAVDGGDEYIIPSITLTDTVARQFKLPPG